MLKNALLGIVILSAFSCNPYVQLVEISSNQMTPNAQKELVFENDTLRIRYDFFSENGHVKFSVFNKLKPPLYINWKESAFIIGTDFFPYWQDKYVSNGFLYGYSFDWDSYWSIFMGETYSVAKRDEQISFIPPGTELYQFEFMAKPNGEFGGIFKGTREDIKAGKRKKIIGTKFRFNENETPLRFRNYLTFSTDAESKSTFVMDTHFWVSEVYKTEGPYVFGAEYQGHHSLNDITRSKRQRDQIGANRFILRANLTPTNEVQEPHRKPIVPQNAATSGSD